MWDGIRNNKIEAERRSPSSEVKSYKLSDEELEKYRNQSVVKEVTKKPLNLHKKGYVRKDDEQVDKSNGLTKEIYLKLHEEGKLDKEIMNEYNMNHNVFYKLKNSWGLVGLNHKGKKKEPKSGPSVEDPARKQQLKKELEKVATEPVTVVADTPIVENIEKPCNCKASLEAKLIELQSRLALKDKQNQELEQSIAALKKYRDMYFTTVEALKIHLP